MVTSGVAAIGGPISASLPTESPAAPADELAVVSDTLVSITPARFVDTRLGFSTFDGQQAGDGKLGPAEEYEIEIAGRGDVPANAAAVVVNVTAVQTEDRGHVTLHPCVDPRPLASSLNYVAGVNVGNEVVAALSSDGSICAYTNRSAHLTIDVVGYVPATGEVSPLVPARLLDTRPGFSTIDGLAAGDGRTSAGSTTTVPVVGRGGVSPADVHSVLVNVTAVNASARGFVVAHGCLPTTPSTSSLNHIAGVNRGNELLVEVDSAGNICLFTSQDIHLTVDVVGYILRGSTVATTTPTRLADSRPGRTTDDGLDAGFGKQSGGSEYVVQVTGRGGVPADAQAAVVNVTAVAPETKGWFTVHPCVTPRPLASSLNYVTGVNGGNELIAGLSGDGSLCIYTNSTAHFTVDLVGYLADSAAPMADLSISKSDDADPINAGATLTYTVTVANAGPDDAENVRVTDALPGDLTLVSTTGCAGDPAGLPLCELGDIANGASKQFTIEATVAPDAATAVISNTATVASDTADPLGGNNTATETTELAAIGTIIIEKITEPAGGTGFAFTDDIAAPNSFTLDDGENQTFSDVPVGSYTVTETDPTPVTLVSITCDDGASATPSVGVPTTGVASIELDPGETVTCSYVNNLNLAPTITSDGGGTTATIDAAENQTAVSDIQTSDDFDSEGAGLTYAITGGADQTLFGIDATTGVLTFLAPPDLENPTDTGSDNVYDVQVTVTDSGLLTDTQDIAITVTDTNDAPVITSDGGGANAGVSIEENTTAATTVTATDEDLPAQTLTATITGGDDQALFSITPAGVLTFDTAPDFENPTDTGGNSTYDVQVTITDNGTPNLTDTQDIAVTVTDVDPEIPPTAVDDTYSATGNVSLDVPAGNGVLLGAGADTGPALTVTEVQGVVANVGVATDTDATGRGGVAGSVTMAADGSFTYRPPPGYVGNDTFTYEVTNGAGADTGTVTLAITDVIWFVDNSSMGANRGTLADPFISTTALNTAQGAAAPAPTDGQTIFVDTGTGTYPDGVALRAGQQLIGEGSSVPIAAAAGLTLAPFSDSLPTTAGAAPVLTDAGGDGVDLNSNNTVRGLTIGSTSGFGLDSEASAGTLSISEVAITGTGGGVDIFGGPGDPINVVLTDLSASSSTAHGIRIQGTNGTFDVLGTGGTIATTSLPAVDVSSSGTDLTYDGIVIANSGIANGINLFANTGTITLGGPLDIDTTTGTGFRAENGGTVIANNATSTIDVSGGGTAVTVANVTIGGPGPTVIGTDLAGTFGLTFQRVNSTDAVNAIVLDNAGSGGFTITGTGTDGSGGTLTNTSSDAIVLRNGTQNVELTNVVVTNTGQHGVVATGNVTNLVVNDSQFTDIGNAPGEEAFSFDSVAGNNIAGQLTLDDVDVTRYFDNGLNVFATSGSVNIDVINGSNFIDGTETTAGATMGQAIIVETEGTAGADLTVNSSLFDNVESDAVRFEAGGSGTNNVDVVGNAVASPGGADNFPNGGSFHMIVTDAATLNFDIQGNVQMDLPGDGIIVSATSGGGNVSGRIGGPTIGAGNVINGGVDSLGFPSSDGITVTDTGVDATIAESMTLLIQNNTINAGGGDDGIQFAVGDNDGTYDVTIRDNTISNTGSEGIRFFFDDDNNQMPDLDLDVIDNGFTVIGDGAIELATRDSGTACANVTGNSDGAGASPGTILLDERDSSAISVPQANTGAIAAANSGATVTIQTNPLTFSAPACAPTLPSHA